MSDSVPSSDPDREAVTDYALTALAALVPHFGQVAADLVRGSLARRSAERQHEFNAQVAAALDRAATISVEEVLGSDEFMAAFERASRIAAETEGAEKRRRLAAAVANMGDWSWLDKLSRNRMLRWAGEFDELEMLLLSYLEHPRRWMEQHVSGWVDDQQEPRSLLWPLEMYVFPPTDESFQISLDRAMRAVAEAGMVPTVITDPHGPDDLDRCHLSAEGVNFLRFVGTE